MHVFDKENFDAQVLSSSELVLVDFWSPKCEPCKELMPEIEALAEKYGDKMKFGKVDVSQNRRLSIGQKVLGLPTIVFYRNGEKVAEMSKDFTAEDVEAKINELLKINT
ncbi:MAG: thiol reductase thioredoxin [Clostridia bacterium]|uniref:thioredoxin TrxA n=1 Tax=Desulfitibacter alkalitolerans TaxID=264641 RepID=UPI000481C998|nr:thioredoxin domain-containing protein [Desulfitibacter alkalitolerans]MBS3969301.1 thiol reductase thioredoxin [Clostridia bacterium]